MQMSASQVSYCYELMEAAYDCTEILQYASQSEPVAIIDPNPRRNVVLAWRSAGHIDPSKERFKQRSSVERVNAALKDSYRGRQLQVRGAANVAYHLLFGTFALTVDQWRRLRTWQHPPFCFWRGRASPRVPLARMFAWMPTMVMMWAGFIEKSASEGLYLLSGYWNLVSSLLPPLQSKSAANFYKWLKILILFENNYIPKIEDFANTQEFAQFFPSSQGLEESSESKKRENKFSTWILFNFSTIFYQNWF